MSGPVRITKPLLNVLEVLLKALSDGIELHGWAIAKQTGLTAPTVYGVVDRLEDARWIDGRWEERQAEPNKPRRRFYRLTPNGTVEARQLLAERRSRSASSRAGGTLPGWAKPVAGGAG